jgi:hypothetical protein
MMRKTIKLASAFLLIGVIICILVFIIPLILEDIEYRREHADVTRNTTPLTAEVVEDICKKFSIQADDPRCQPGATVYAPEFFDDIESYLYNLPKDQANDEEVSKLLGFYEYYREPITHENNGYEYYRVWYDLRGDRVNRLVISYRKDGSIIEIMNSSGGS